MEFETEEQQVEALKKWWKENGKQIIVGAVVGIAAITGWKTYIDYSTNQTAQASALFEQVIKDTADGTESNKAAVFEKIKKQYSGTPYYSASGLVVAKYYYDAGEKEKAINVLNELILDNSNEVITFVAIERKARILIDLGKADDAIKALSVDAGESFKAIFEELKGDALVSLGRQMDARAAYDKALLLYQAGSNKLLQMKRDNLGESIVEPAA